MKSFADRIRSKLFPQPGDADHGRIETRIAMVSTDIDWLQQDHRRLAAIGKVTRIRETAAKTTTERLKMNRVSASE